MASREELLKIALQGVRTKGTGGRTLDITKILPGISAEDWGVEGLGRNRSLGGGGIPTTASTNRYIFQQQQAQLPVPQYPWYYNAIANSDTAIAVKYGWGKTPTSVKRAAAQTGNAMLTGLYTLAIPISMVASTLGDGVIAVNNFFHQNAAFRGLAIGDATTTAASRARMREEIWGPNGDAGVIERLGNQLTRIWDKRNRGAHEHYYGHGDTFAAIGLWQDKDVGDLAWWANRALAVSLDLATDPLNALTIAGKTAKGIQYGMKAGWGNKLFHGLTRTRIEVANSAILGQLDQNAIAGVRAFFAKPQVIRDLTDDIVKIGKGELGNVGKIVTREGDNVFIDLGKHMGLEVSTAPTPNQTVRVMGTFVAGPGATGTMGRQAVKLKLPQSLLDDLPKLVTDSMDASLLSLGKLAPKDYRRIGGYMKEIGMDLKFRVAGEKGWKAGLTSREVNEAMNFAYKLPGTGFIGRRFTNPVLRMLNKKPLDGPIPWKIFSLENQFLGLPMRKAMQGFQKFFLGRGNRWNRGGRMKDLKRLIRNPNTNPLMIHEYKGSVHAAGRGAQTGRRTFQEMDRLYTEFKTNAQAHPELTGEKGGAIIGRAMGGDPAALAQLKKIDPALEKGAWEFMDRLREIANRRGGFEWLGHTANYRPRPLSKRAAERMSRRGLGPKAGKRPYEPAGFEKGRGYLNVDEFKALTDDYIAEQLAKGITTTEAEARTVIAAKGYTDDIFGHKLYKPGSAKPDGSLAKDVETQVADILGEMGINYSLFEEDAYKFIPEYIRGLSARTGEVFTESLMLEKGIFIDRMVRLKAVPTQRVQAAWVDVMKGQAALRRIAGGLDDSLTLHATAVGDERAMLAHQIAEQERVATLANARYRAAVSEFDDLSTEALAAEARAAESIEELANLKNEYLEQVTGMGLDDAVAQQIIKNDLDEKIVRVFGENNFLKSQLTNLRAATYARLAFEDALITRYGSMEVLVDLKKFVAGFDAPLTAPDGFEYWDGSSEVIWNWVRDNSARLENDATRRSGVDSFEMIGDGLFRVKLGGVMHDQDQVYGLLRAGDDVLESMDGTPFGEWLVVDQEADGLAFTDDFFQLKRLEQTRRKMVDKTTGPSDLLSQYVEAGGKATWAGEVPTPETVMAARETIKNHFEAAAAELAAVVGPPAPFGHLMDQAMSDPSIASAIHTYYQVFGDDILKATSMRNMDDIDSFVTQIEAGLRERSGEIAEALAGFNQVTFDVADRAGTILRYGLPEYARMRSFQIGRVEVMASRGMPLRNMDTPIDNILAGNLVAANNSGEMGVIGGSNPGGRYRVKTNSGVKDYYVKRMEAHVDSDPAWLATAGDVGERRAFSEVLANSMYRELGFQAPVSYAQKSSNGSWYVVAPWADDLIQVGVNPAGGFRPRAESLGAYVDTSLGVPKLTYGPEIFTAYPGAHLPPGVNPISDIVGEGFLADAFLANWDTAGLDIENIAFDQAGNLFRVDGGGTFNFRAQGLPKTTFGFKWKRPGESIAGLMDVNKSPTYAPMANAWRDAQPDVVQSLIGQYRQLDQVRMDYGGWANFVRRHLPDGTSDDAMSEFIEFLEVRHKALAEGFGQEYAEGAALAKARIHQQGASPAVADEIISGNYGPHQGMSEGYGYPAWLSPEHDGISESQAIDWFTIEEALGHVAEGRKLGNAAETAIARDEELLRQLRTYVDEEFDVLVDDVGTQEAAWSQGDPYPGGDFSPPGYGSRWMRGDEGMADDFANPWANKEGQHYWGDEPMAADARFGMIVVDEQGRPLMRMPTAADGTAGDPFGGVLWTFAKGGAKPGESPYQTAVRETLEETGLVVEGFGQIRKPMKGTTSTNYYYIGRIKPGSSRPSVIAERQLVDERATEGMAQFMHTDSMSPHVSHSQDPSSNLLIGPQSSWFDTWSTNYSGITDVYNTYGSPMYYPIQVNVGTASDQMIVYGLPAQAKDKVAAFVMAQRLPKGTTHAERLAIDDAMKGAGEELDDFLAHFTGSQTSLSAQDIAGNHQAMDFMTRLSEFDRNTYDHMLHLWRSSGDTDYQTAAAVLDFVDNFKQWDISSVNSMSLKERIGFLDFLDRRGLIGRRGGIPDSTGRVEAYTIEAASVKKGKQPRYNFGTGVTTPAKALRPSYVRDITDVEMHGYVAEYLAQFDEGNTMVAQWKADIMGPMGNGSWGRRVAGAQREARNWNKLAFLDELDPLSSGADHRIQQREVFNEIMALEKVQHPVVASPQQRTVTGMQSAFESPFTSIETAGAPVAKNIDEILDLVQSLSDPSSFNRKVARGQIEAFLEDRRVMMRAYDVYKRSLTADGINVGLWYNMADSHVGRSAKGFTNAFLPNPHAVRAMPKAAVSGRIRTNTGVIADAQFAPDGGGFVRTGEGDAPGGVLNAQKFMDEYERAVMDAGLTRERPVGDPIRDALDVKIEMAIKNEDYFVQEMAARQAQVKQATDSLDILKGEAKAAAITKKQRAEWKALNQSIDKRMKMAVAAEGALHRLGTIDAAGRAIPLEDLPDEVRNLRLAVSALEDADARGFTEALDLLQEGADGAKFLRQVGEFGDDTIYFPLNREFMSAQHDRFEVLDEAFQSGFTAFGIKSQGPSEIVESMVAVDRFYAQGGFGAFLRQYDKIHNLLKGYMIMKPGFHMRNYFSAIFMNYLDGVQFSSYRQFQNAYWQHEYDKAITMNMPRRAESMKKAMKLRGIRGQASAADMDIIRQLDAEGLIGGAQGQIGTEFAPGTSVVGGKLAKALQAVNPISSRNAPLRLSRNVGIGTETYVRGVMAFDSLKRGDLAEEAFERVMKFHFDYSDLSKFEASGIKRVVPFYTWTRKNLPLMIEQIGKRPGVFNQYNILKANIENMSEGMEGADAILPPWMVRQAGIRLPFKYDGEFMSVLPDLPFKTPLEMLGPLTNPGDTPSERIQAALGVMTTQLTPFVKTPIEWTTRRNMWKGYNFDGRYDEVPTVYTKVPGLMWGLKGLGMAEKNSQGTWLMRDYDLHSVASLSPTLSDIRRLAPTEERYQQRTLSTWMSFLFGLGLRTNTKEEQQRTLKALRFEQQAERTEQRRRQRAGLNP